MSEWRFIVSAYTATWVVVVGYTIYLAVRERGARRDLVGALGDGR